MASEASVTVRRAFQWGIVFMLAEESKGAIPTPINGQIVSANDAGISVTVRHAQDTDEFEGEYLKFAEVELGFRVLDYAERALRWRSK